MHVLMKRARFIVFIQKMLKARYRIVGEAVKKIEKHRKGVCLDKLTSQETNSKINVKAQLRKQTKYTLYAGLPFRAAIISKICAYFQGQCLTKCECAYF